MLVSAAADSPIVAWLRGQHIGGIKPAELPGCY